MSDLLCDSWDESHLTMCMKDFHHYTSLDTKARWKSRSLVLNGKMWPLFSEHDCERKDWRNRNYQTREQIDKLVDSYWNSIYQILQKRNFWSTTYESTPYDVSRPQSYWTFQTCHFCTWRQMHLLKLLSWLWTLKSSCHFWSQACGRGNQIYPREPKRLSRSLRRLSQYPVRQVLVGMDDVYNNNSYSHYICVYANVRW